MSKENRDRHFFIYHQDDDEKMEAIAAIFVSGNSNIESHLLTGLNIIVYANVKK